MLAAQVLDVLPEPAQALRRAAYRRRLVDELLSAGAGGVALPRFGFRRPVPVILGGRAVRIGLAPVFLLLQAALRLAETAAELPELLQEIRGGVGRLERFVGQQLHQVARPT